MSQLTNALKKHPKLHIILVVVLLISVTGVQYSKQLGLPEIFPFSLLGFQRFTIGRLFYLITIIHASLAISPKAGYVTSITALIVMIPRAFFYTTTPIDSISESILVVIIGIVFSFYISIQKRLKEQKDKAMADLEKMEENLRFYLRQAVMAQEEERKRLSRELHDDTVQFLGGISRSLDNFIRKNTYLLPEDIDALKKMYERLNTGLRDVQRFSQDLRPSILDYLGLITALRSLANKANERHQIEIDFHVTGVEKRFRPEIEILIFRVVQEALSNVEKHAQATKVRIMVDFSETKTKFSIIDNGKGFQMPGKLDDLPRTGKLGLAGIQERVILLGGILQVNSYPGKGTTVYFEIPV
ncbi:MAG: ATP-binding protein [Chloroflexi bacterium]|nr:ATP-binding protein [Chloroflexota bacterium]